MEKAQSTPSEKSDKFRFELNVYAPCNAKVTELSNHPNQLVKDGFVGKGISFIPTGSQLFSPISGQIIYFPQTCEQLRIKHPSGLLIHIEFGINTANLMAESFRKLKSAGQTVKRGELIFEYNLPLLNNKLTSLMSYICIANLNQEFEFSSRLHSVKAIEDIVFTIKK